MSNNWRTINSLVHKIRLHGRRGNGTAKFFPRDKLRQAPQKEGGVILCDSPPVWPRLVHPPLYVTSSVVSDSNVPDCRLHRPRQPPQPWLHRPRQQRSRLHRPRQPVQPWLRRLREQCSRLHRSRQPRQPWLRHLRLHRPRLYRYRQPSQPRLCHLQLQRSRLYRPRQSRQS